MLQLTPVSLNLSWVLMAIAGGIRVKAGIQEAIQTATLTQFGSHNTHATWTPGQQQEMGTE